MPNAGGGAFVGRAHELATLGAALATARAGQGGVVMLSGEPGIGKTRTAEEFARRACADGAEVLVGRCYEGGGAPGRSAWPRASTGPDPGRAGARAGRRAPGAGRAQRRRGGGAHRERGGGAAGGGGGGGGARADERESALRDGDRTRDGRGRREQRGAPDRGAGERAGRDRTAARRPVGGLPGAPRAGRAVRAGVPVRRA